ncbi:MAG: FeoA domain-containing protein [Asgard group archaeon]|nr:FeoA domain-containing protein [Asgard group archaeon]
MNQKLENLLLEIAKENILRVLIEQTPGFEKRETLKKLTQEEIIPESWYIVPKDFFTQAVKELEKKGYITVKDDVISLTRSGEEQASHIYETHKVIEELFKEDFDEKTAHIFAHILEHLISREVIDSMKEIDKLRGHGVSLLDYPSKEGIITQLLIEDSHLMERIISMGVCPGQKIKIITRLKVGVVVKLKRTKLAIDNDVAKGIMIAA